MPWVGLHSVIVAFHKLIRTFDVGNISWMFVSNFVVIKKQLPHTGMADIMKLVYSLA